MSGGRKSEEPGIFSGVTSEGAEPDDFWPPDCEEGYLEPRILLLKKSWRAEARKLVKELVARGLSTGDIHLKLDHWQTLRQDFPPDDFPPKWERKGGRSSEAPARWCSAILEIATPDDKKAFGDAVRRAHDAATEAIRGREITDRAFAHLQNCPWVGLERGGVKAAPLPKRIRETARKRWVQGRG